jgi:hypothetical protein
MRFGIALLFCLVLSIVALASLLCAETFTTPVLDGAIGGDWDIDSFFDVVYIDECAYTLHITWDADFLWIGLDSDSCRRFLGDSETDMSFFVAIDTDQTYGSGAYRDEYGNVNFYGCLMPEFIFFYAGGAGWYEWGRWDEPSTWTWLGWRNDNTYYAWDGGGVYDDEMGILWSDIGNPTGISVMAWISDETCFGGCGEHPCAGALAVWPALNPPANCANMLWVYPFSVPHVPGPMPLAGYAPNTVVPANWEASATKPSSWGEVKALYR